MFKEQSTISQENLEELMKNAHSVKQLTEKLRQTTTYNSYQVGKEEHLKLREVGKEEIIGQLQQD